MKKNKIIFFTGIIICLVVLLGSIVYYLVSPVKKISAPTQLRYSSLPDFALSKSKEILSNIQSNGTNNIVVQISGDDMDEVLELSRESLKSSSSALAGVTAMHAEIKEGADYLYIDDTYSGFINTQFIVKFVPKIVDNRVAVQIESVHVGRITLPRNVLLKRISGKNKNYTVDENSGTIIIDTDFPEALTLKSIDSKNNMLELHFGISLNSIDDLINLMHIIP